MRVLVVEDEESVATGVRRALTGAGYQVDVAADGRQGFEAALAGCYDLIVLDVMLPGMNGYELCRSVRGRGVNSSILMLSAKRGEWDVAEGLDLGADDYLTKPFSVVELLARVRARARSLSGLGSGGTRFAIDDLRFDPTVRRCWRREVEIELTGRETSLLSVLFDHVGRVVHKDELLSQAWSPDHLGAHNVVEVYVGRLRRKLDVPFGVENIETVRGVGYRLRGRESSP